MSNALPEWLVEYVLKRDQQRADEVNAVLASMNERERRLVREAAVMADDPDWRPDGFAERAAGLGLDSAERAMLRYALELAEDKMASEGDEFTDDDHAAVASLKRLAVED